MLVVGIIIGVLAWQIFCYFLVENEKECLTYIFISFIISFIKGIYYFIYNLVLIKTFPILIRNKINPFRLSVSQLLNLSIEDKDLLIECMPTRKMKQRLRETFYGQIE